MLTKLQSTFQKIGNDIRNAIHFVFIRFPIPALFSIHASLIGLLAFHEITDESLYRILLTLILGFPLFISIQIIRERYELPHQKGYIALAIGALLLFGYMLLLPNSLEEFENKIVIQSFMWGAGFLLMIPCIPFLKDSEKPLPFWHYVKYLFQAIVQAVVFSVILCAGISAIVWSLKALFSLDLGNDRYAEIWIIGMGIIAPFFFLSHIPKTDIKDDSKYPKALAILTQYILSPLLIAYACILLAYTGKIGITGIWPEGVVGYLILWFASVGIITHYIMTPSIEKSSILQKGVSGFYLFLIPQSIILLVSILLRIQQYGVTENRYMVVVLGLWLLSMSVWYTIARKPQLISFLMSFVTLLFFASFGPWGIFSVSQMSQTGRLKSILEYEEILIDNTIIPSETIRTLEKEEHGLEIYNILTYLHQYHSLESIESWFRIDIGTIAQTEDEFGKTHLNRYNIPQEIMEYIGVSFVQIWDKRNPDEPYYQTYRINESGIPAIQFLNDTVLITPLESYTYQEAEKRSIEHNGTRYTIAFDILKQAIIVQTSQNEVFEFSINEFLSTQIIDFESEKRHQTQTIQNPIFQTENETLVVTFVLQNINLKKEPQKPRYDIEHIQGILFLQEK